MKKCWLPLVFVVLSLLSPILTRAQSIGMFSSTGQSITVAGAPFQAMCVGRVRDIESGTIAVRDVQGRIARDSDGRVRVEEQLEDQSIGVVVFDPVTGTQMRWKSSSPVVTVSMVLALPPWHLRLSSNPMLLAREEFSEDTNPQTVSKQDLGKKKINGLEVTGTRITVSDSAGKIVHDVWYSDDLKLVEMDTFTDESGQKQTILIQDIARTEPDPALFRAPEGYAVKDIGNPLSGGVMGGIRGPAMPPPNSLPSPPPPPTAPPPTAPRPVEAPPPPVPEGTARIQVDAAVQAAKIIGQPQPMYPAIARQLNISGDVVLDAIIAQDGTVSYLDPISGNALLRRAALFAVYQWRYQPTLVNGVPVEVETTITVPFVPPN